MKRHMIIGFIILSIFGANLFATTDIFSKHDSHNKLCSLHEHQHTHNTLKHTHSHNHKVNFVDFYITDNIQIGLVSYTQKDNFSFAQQYFYTTSQKLFRPPIV